MRQKKTFSVLILGWIFLSLFSVINFSDGANVDDHALTSFKVGDKVVYRYRTYSYQNPITGFAWSSTKYELYNITEISETINELIIKADFWDRDSLSDLVVGYPDQEDIILGRLRYTPNIGDIIIPNNIKPKDYKNAYLSEIEASINNPAVTNTIQSYARGQGLYVENKYGSNIIGNHRILYATTGILLKESYEVSMGTTSDFTAEKEIVPSRSSIAGADESYSDVIINPWLWVFIFVGVPGLILSVVIIRKIVLKSKGIQVIKQDLTQKSPLEKKSSVLCPFCYTEIGGDDIYCLNCGKKLEEIKQEVSNNPTIIKKPRVLCPFCHTEIDGEDNYCLNCGKKLEEIKQEEIKQEISNNPAIIKKPRVLCPFCNSELDRSNNYCFKCNRHTKKEESSNSFVFVIFSLTGGLLAFLMIYLPVFTNPTGIFLVCLGLVIFA